MNYHTSILMVEFKGVLSNRIIMGPFLLIEIQPLLATKSHCFLSTGRAHYLVMHPGPIWGSRLFGISLSLMVHTNKKEPRKTGNASRGSHGEKSISRPHEAVPCKSGLLGGAVAQKPFKPWGDRQEVNYPARFTHTQKINRPGHENALLHGVVC